MDSLSRALPFYLVISLGMTVAYVVLSNLFKSLLAFLCRQQRDNPSPNHDQSASAANVTLQVDSTTATQLEEHTAITCVDRNMPENESCSVCLGDYLAGDELRVLLNCKHMFHKECIDRWLVMRSSFCPICRGRVIVRNERSVVLGDGDVSLDELGSHPQRLVHVLVEINVVHPHLI